MHLVQRVLESSDHGTLSRVLYEKKLLHYVLEPPWRNNEPSLSCIPSGVYNCVWHKSPRYGMVYLITNVPGRSLILRHWGNFGGDSLKGLKTNTLGCQLLGKNYGYLWNGKQMQRAVLNSRTAVDEFHTFMQQRQFTLEVKR